MGRGGKANDTKQNTTQQNRKVKSNPKGRKGIVIETKGKGYKTKQIRKTKEPKNRERRTQV